MFQPLTLLTDDLSQQRRIDAIELMEIPQLKLNEIEKIEEGLFKYNVMWWFNRVGYCALWGIVYKGKLADRGNVHSVGIFRACLLFWISTQYLLFGDFLASSLLWEEYKYILYKYEPELRIKRKMTYPRFLTED